MENPENNVQWTLFSMVFCISVLELTFLPISSGIMSSSLRSLLIINFDKGLWVLRIRISSTPEKSVKFGLRSEWVMLFCLLSLLRPTMADFTLQSMGISNETIHCPDYNDAVSSCPQGLFRHETRHLQKGWNFTGKNILWK